MEEITEVVKLTPTGSLLLEAMKISVAQYGHLLKNVENPLANSMDNVVDKWRATTTW